MDDFNRAMLQHELHEYLENNINLKSTVYNDDLIKETLRKYDNCNMVRKCYDSTELNMLTWQEVYDADIYGFNKESVKKIIEDKVKDIEESLYEEGRFFIYEGDKECHILIYVKDIFRINYEITMWNK